MEERFNFLIWTNPRVRKMLSMCKSTSKQVLVIYSKRLVVQRRRIQRDKKDGRMSHALLVIKRQTGWIGEYRNPNGWLGF
jgi:hypothetical protein